MPRGRLLEIDVLRRASARPEDSELNSEKLAATFPGRAASGEHSLLSLFHGYIKAYHEVRRMSSKIRKNQRFWMNLHIIVQ